MLTEATASTVTRALGREAEAVVNLSSGMKRREKKGARAVSNRAEDWSESWPPREKAGVEDGEAV